MKCRVCREPAIIDIRRHNANFCTEHFLRLCRDQVAKAIHDFDMIGDGERVLVAVSGGKDSLALWDLLVELGYHADGLYLGLGIGDYSDESGRRSRAYAEQRGLTLHEVDLPDEHGFDIPTGARAARRAPCSACGLSKRHLFDKAALDGGYDVVATGHNLDDEAAVLFGNVLRWQTEYLGRQRPVLPAEHGFPRKVKPLVRLGEREMAAYCIVRGIDYIVEECPMAAGNKHLGYKEALNALEVASPGTKHDFYFGYLARAVGPLPLPGRRRPRPAPPVPVLRGADHGRRVRVLSADRAGAGGDVTDPTSGRPLADGDKALLVDHKGRRYLVTLKAGAEFHSHAGFIPHDEIIGAADGSLLRSTKGSPYRLLRPTLADFVLKMPRGAQVIYPKDLGPILMLADIAPGMRVLESGVGSGALSMTLLRAGAEVVGYELREDFANRAQANVSAFLGEDAMARYRVELRDCYAGIDERDLDRVVLDLPEPWQVVDHAGQALRPGGILVAYTPSILQATRLREALDAHPFGLAETLEVLHRTWHVEGQAVRPDHRMVAHTGFLTHARLLGG